MLFARFILIMGIKSLGLLFLAMLAAKSVGGLRGGGKRTVPIEIALYATVLSLVIWGAATLGYDLAAETYIRASARQAGRKNLDLALANAQRAVELRSRKLGYWQTLSGIKFAQKQYGSVIADALALRELAGGKLEEPDAYRLAVCHYLLGEFDQVHPLTQALTHDNPAYAAPQVLEGYTLVAERQYDQASRVFMGILRMYPNQQSAVEGLAHAQFLMGNRASALSVLEQTSEYAFSPEARRRFEALKGIYGLS